MEHIKNVIYTDTSSNRMLAIIVGHIIQSGELHQWLYVWHVPLFFYISGYFLNCCKGKKFFADQARRLLIPYFFIPCF